MQALAPVIVDLATGVVMLGGTRVALERDGEHYVSPDGLRTRALTFEERSSVVAGALMEREPNRALLSKLRNLANVPAGAEGALADALLLALAGGGEPAPDFAECARAACRRAHLDWQSVQTTAAVVVDQLASDGEQSRDEGWTRFEFREAPETPLSLEEYGQQMLERLLERGTQHGTEQAPEAAAALHVWRTKERSPEKEQYPQRDLPDSARTAAELRPRSTETPAAQPLRAHVTLAHVNRPSPPSSEESERPPSLSFGLREVSIWHEPGRPAQPAPDSERRKSHAGPLLDASQHLQDWPSIAHQALRSTQASVQTPTARKQMIAATPAKTRIRAPRIRDLAARSGPAPAPPKPPAQLSPAGSDAAAGTLHPSHTATAKADLKARSLPQQRDWLYEIATALAHECDLRGLDA